MNDGSPDYYGMIMGHDAAVQMGTNKMTPRYAFHKPFHCQAM
jgi:hypothetical protein